MSHAIHRVEHFEIVGPYRLRIRFDDNSQQEIDFRPVLEGDVFGPLQDPSVFNAVALDKEAGTLTWPPPKPTSRGRRRRRRTPG